MSIETLAELTWNEMYPDRKPWKDIGEQAKKEWIQVFNIFLRHYVQSIKNA